MKFGVDLASPARATTSTRCDAARAGRRGRARCGTPTTICTASTRSIVPGGFSYGDYLRAGAIARFAPVMAEVERVRPRRRARARDLQRLPGLCEAGLLPGRAAPERLAAVRLPPGRRSRSSTATRRSRARATPGQRLSIPVKHTTGRYYAPPSSTGSRRRAGRAPLRARREPERLAARHRRRLQRARQRVRPDAAPRARRRSADRLDRRADDLRVDASACPRQRRLV